MMKLKIKNAFPLTLKGALVLLGLALCFLTSAQVQVTTYHNDNFRTGLNSAETKLNLSNVNLTRFGLLFNLPVDGQVYAQPLYLPRVNVPGKGIHSVVYVATQHNSLYAFDAVSNTGVNSQPLWHRNFGSTVPREDTNAWDILPEVGITSTPVISLANANQPVIYVVAKTKTVVNSNPVYAQYLHAINASSGLEMPGSPVAIAGSVAGTGDASVNGTINFDPLLQHCRPALLLVSNTSYIALDGSSKISNQISAPNVPVKLPIKRNILYLMFASHGDYGPYHGWVFAYDADKMQLLKIWNTTPNAKTDPSGYPLAAGGIWQSGGGPAFDGYGIYFATGNGTFDPGSQSYGDATVRLDSNSLGVTDYFAPSNQLYLDDVDADLGACGPMLLPSSASGSSGKNLLVQSGKEGTIYLLDTANMGHNGPSDNIVQELPYVMGGVWGAPAYFNNTVYYGPQYSGLVSFPIRNGRFTTSSPSSYTPTYFQYPGPTPSVSANGSRNGIVWAVQTDGAEGSGNPAILHAYQASDLSVELYNSALAPDRDGLGSPVKFVTPTIADGHVYVGYSGAVGVFGLGTWAALPVISPASGNYQNSVSVTVTDSTPGSVIYYTTDGSVPTLTSTKYVGPVTLTASTVFKAKAFLSDGSGGSPVAESDYLINAVIGTGTGLTGNYYNNSQNPGGAPTWTEVDPTVNFNWNGGSPANGVAGTNWAGEWTGKVQAEVTGTYTISTNSDDGVQVYINGQLVINDYGYHAPTLDYGTVNLVAGQKYSIDVKFFQGSGGSVLQLFWATPGISNQIIPTSQLYPN